MDTADFKRIAGQGLDWIKQNPTQAALVGVGAGFAFGFLGIARVAIGVRTLAALPGVTDFVKDFAVKNFGAGFGENSSTESSATLN